MDNLPAHLPVYTTPQKIKEITILIGRTKAYELEASDHTFPKRIRPFGSRGPTAWRTAELLAWIERQAR